MALDAAIIRTRLAAAPSEQRDNEAQNIINNATPAELKSLNTEAVLRLYEAIVLDWPRIYSSRDAAAIQRLAAYSQYQPAKTPQLAINLVKGARAAHGNIQIELSPQIVTRIYVAEHKRLSWYEHIGFDGDTIGRGQLGQAAYTDVVSKQHFRAEFQECMAHVYLPRMLGDASKDPSRYMPYVDMSTYSMRVPADYQSVWREEALEDFVVSAYLAIRLQNASKPGRTSKDAARFAVALYHGMRDMVTKAQNCVVNDLSWPLVEGALLSQGFRDEVAYVNEVVK